MAAVRPQLPLTMPVVDLKTGRITQPWAFYQTALQNSLPAPGTNDGTFGTVTANQVNTKGLTATNGQIGVLSGNSATFSGTVTADLFIGDIQGSITTAVSALKAVNLAYGNAGQVVYQIAPGLTGYITVGQDGQFLTLANGLPRWSNVAAESVNQGWGTGGGTDEVFFLNSQTVTTDYTIPDNTNAHSVGPITNDAIVTIGDNSIWLIEGEEVPGTVTLTGDVSGSDIISNAIITTLATVNSNIGIFGDSYDVPQITVNAKGLITSVSNVAVIIPSGNITVTGTDLTMSGVTGVNITNAVLNTVNSNVGQFGNSTAIPTFTVNSKGLITSASNISIVTGNVQLIGDISANGPLGSNITATLATVNTNTGQWGDASHVSQVTVNGKGLVTAASNIAIPNTVQISGDATSTGGTTSSNAVMTLNTVNANTGQFGDTTHVPQFTVNGKGLITAAGNVAINTMVYPGAGVAVSSGSAWTTSYTTTGTGNILVMNTSPTIRGTITGNIAGAITALSVSANAIAVDMSANNNFSVTLQATTTQTLSNPTNATSGTSGQIAITQNATPSVLNFASNWYSVNGSTTVNSVAGSVTLLTYYVVDSTHIWYGLGYGVNAGVFTTLSASSTFTASGAVVMNPASNNVSISPSGTGTVTISPAGALTINPTAASTINNVSIGAGTASAASTEFIAIAAGTTAIAPIGLTVAGSVVNTSPAAGAIETDTTSLYYTSDTTNGRTLSDRWNYFRLTGSGSGITTIADFFGANSAIPLVTSGIYEIEWHCYFSKATAGTATWTVTSTNALQTLTGEYIGSPIAGIGTVGTPQTAAINVTASTATAFPVTGTEATGATHYFTIRVMLQANATTGGNTRLRMTNSAGTATPLVNSYYRVRRLPAGNTGTFVA